ncbi:hypothetical protein [Novosphingobium humi]|uniref:DnaA N-terminal domain-containing protein n=1 Tax=Novosphingobium humi TaxID=2282397 RepID=A0ABY7U0Z5_9SPHN|nr:hypothetical protein [Novosphingobium humi]WCT78893.1 hypothetical protein PQ457_08025 [Novosphingobium humi]
MSTETTNWAKQQRCGCPHVKAVLGELANWARPDGVCEFRKVSDIAFVTEISERTVQRALKKLEDPVSAGGLGLIRRIGRRRGDGGIAANGFELVGYIYPGDTLTPTPVSHSHPPRCQSVTYPVTSRRGRGCQSVTPNKDLDLENNTPLNPPKRGRKIRLAISDDWIVPALAELPDNAKACASQWPDGAYAAQAEAFSQYHRGTGQRRADWRALWAAWVIKNHEAVMRQARAGGAPAAQQASTGLAAKVEHAAAKSLETSRSADLHDALREALGAGVWASTIEPAALVFADDGLRVVAPTEFRREQIEARHMAAIHDGLRAIGVGVDWVVVECERAGKRRGRVA